MRTFKIKGKVARYPGLAGWHFVHLDKKISDKIRNTKNLKKKVAWGYVKATTTIGKTSWETTLFPSKKDGVYLLAIKANVRKSEGVYDGDVINIKITLH